MIEKNQFGQLVGGIIEDWRGALKPNKELSLQGRYCMLVPIELHQHATKLYNAFAINNKGDSWTYLPYGPFETQNDFENWLNRTLAEPDTLLYAILDEKTQEPIGIAGFLRINPPHGVIEIGHLHFSAKLRQTALATEAIYLLLQYAFDSMGYRRCEWKCHHFNEPSKLAAKRFGFTFEGVFRQSNVFKERNRDTAWFSIIDTEWPLIQRRFEKWLHPDNFDVTGMQILKLADV